MLLSPQLRDQILQQMASLPPDQQERVLAFVEGALERTSPGKPFTIAVLASLPLLTTSAKAATLGAVAAKGSLAAKTAAGVGLFNAILSPVLGLVGPWLQYRVSLKAARSDHERRNIRRFYRRLFGLILGFGALLTALTMFSGKFVGTHPLLFACVLVALVAGYIGAAIRLGVWANAMWLRQEPCRRPELRAFGRTTSTTSLISCRRRRFCA